MAEKARRRVYKGDNDQMSLKKWAERPGSWFLREIMAKSPLKNGQRGPAAGFKGDNGQISIKKWPKRPGGGFLREIMTKSPLKNSRRGQAAGF